MLENKTNKKIDKIRKEVEICRNIKNQDNEIKCYEEKLNQEIKGDKYTFLVYSMEVEKELDLNFSAFWVSTLALIISCFFSVSSAIKEFYDNAGIKKIGNIIANEKNFENTIKNIKMVVYADAFASKFYIGLLIIGIVGMFLAIMYYTVVKNTRKKYLQIKYALQNIMVENEW